MSVQQSPLSAQQSPSSAQQSPLTYEGVLEMLRETGERMRETERIIQGIARRQEEAADRMIQEIARRQEEAAEQRRETDRKIQEAAEQSAEQRRETDRKIQEAAEQRRRETDRIIQETAEQGRESYQKLERLFQETSEQMKETDKQIRRTSQEIGKLGSRVGDMVENMVGSGNIVAQFRDLGHHVIAHSRRKIFGERGTDASGQIDLFLENGDIAILVEVKTTLKNDDILDHIERIEKYRRWIDVSGNKKKQRYIGAVASPFVEENVAKFAHRKGFYVITQSGDLFEIMTPPKGFEPKTW